MGQSGMGGLHGKLDAMASGCVHAGGRRQASVRREPSSGEAGNAPKSATGGKSMGLLSEAIAARLIHRPDPVKPNMPKSGRSDGGSVRASMAKRLSMMKLYGKAGTSSAGGASGGRAGGTKAQQAIYVSTSQNVVVKAFVSRHGLSGTPRGGSALSKHLHYLVRDGVGYEGQNPELFDRRAAAQQEQSDPGERGHEIGDMGHGEGGNGASTIALEHQALDDAAVPSSSPTINADVTDHCASWEQDRHHFRFIISPEHGDRIKDMPAYAKAVMADVARDLKEPGLQWVGVCHYDTDQPHAHIVVRGKRANGRDLVIPRRYIAYGMRARAHEQATAVLGEISRTQAEKDLFARTMSDRWTDIDAKLSRVAHHNGGIFPNHELDRTDTYGAVMRGRARHLEALGLATKTSDGLVLVSDMRQKLDSLAVKLGDEKFDIWHEAVRAKAKPEPQKMMDGPEIKRSAQSAPIHPDPPVQSSPTRQVEPPEREVNPYQSLVTAQHLTALDITLEQRAQTIQKGERPTYYAKAVEEALEARGDILVKNSLAKDHGAHVSVTPQGWNQLQQADLVRAVQQQLGLSSDRLSQVHRCDEGRIVGQVNTALGQFTIVDRGVGLVAFKSTPGLELAVGLELGSGLER
jgi:hypothetical protein